LAVFRSSNIIAISNFLLIAALFASIKKGSYMNLKFKLIFSAVILILTNGCSTYSEEDYGDSDVSKKESLCINMEPSQEMKCKESENSLQIGLGADKNCNHPYEYEKNQM